MHDIDYGRSIPREALRNPHGIGGVQYPSAHDPTHARAWSDVRDGRKDYAQVVGDSGAILFQAWRVSALSWAWQTATMPAPAFARYGDGL
jgi:hypothetical protein